MLAAKDGVLCRKRAPGAAAALTAPLCASTLYAAGATRAATDAVLARLSAVCTRLLAVLDTRDMVL